jgi:hypothetical protein
MTTAAKTRHGPRCHQLRCRLEATEVHGFYRKSVVFAARWTENWKELCQHECSVDSGISDPTVKLLLIPSSGGGVDATSRTIAEGIV